MTLHQIGALRADKDHHVIRDIRGRLPAFMPREPSAGGRAPDVERTPS
ncbi:hypothetical protein [Streptomyces bohaiensis]|uniref:Uncharacterized protein n=1 Tax=Streptomyces bohaiensis TaxID=1431344 RepID=A0ABX1CF20_9ACTN|nr:hypothetical protein [Streptomyces bohaiensis]NJQ16513.1 hypothetical protein [Streptomyces bohaiensis]